MAMTITEKILAAHAGLESVEPGQIINVKVDVALANDITAPIAIKAFRKAGATKVFDKKRVALVPDHFAPNKDIESVEQCKMLRDFAKEQDLENYFETGEMGVEHALLPEQGIVGPGDVVIGAEDRARERCALSGGDGDGAKGRIVRGREPREQGGGKEEHGGSIDRARLARRTRAAQAAASRPRSSSTKRSHLKPLQP